MDEIVARSRDSIKRGSKSFAGAARLFDRETRASVYMLYAWCRHCDDVIDDQDLGYEQRAVETDRTVKLERLRQLREKTRLAFDGKAEEPVFVALGRVVAKHEIPYQHPMELLDGFRMDAEGQTFEDINKTLTYCYLVAGVVGVMMAIIMGIRDRDTLNRASDLGIALQLTNIARDVLSDAEIGRVYLPANWLSEAGVPGHALRDPEQREALFCVVERLLLLADNYYASSVEGLPQLDFRSACAVAAAKHIYSDIGRVIRRRGSNAWDQRAIVSKGRKFLGVARGVLVAANSQLSGKTATVRPRTDLWTRPDLGD